MIINRQENIYGIKMPTNIDYIRKQYSNLTIPDGLIEEYQYAVTVIEELSERYNEIVLENYKLRKLLEEK